MSEGQIRKTAPLLPPDAGRDRPLFAVAAILVFLACLAALGAVGAWQAAAGWTDQMTNEVTIQLLPADDRDGDADAEAAGALLQEMPGVLDVDVRSREEAEDLLQPWLGRSLPDDLPLPRLIAITVDPENPPEATAYDVLFEEAPYDIIVDQHGQWSAAVERAANAVRYFALSLVVLLTGAASAVVAFAARASLAARWDVADALHLVGATDQYIAALFQRRFFILGLASGSAGALSASATAYLLAIVGGSAGTMFFLPGLDLGLSLFFIPPIAAMMSGLTAAMAARLSVSHALQARWS